MGIFQTVPIVGMIMYFIVYIVIHTILGYKRESVKKEMYIKPGNEILEKRYKTLNRMFKWFPAVYVVFILIMFYVF